MQNPINIQEDNNVRIGHSLPHPRHGNVSGLKILFLEDGQWIWLIPKVVA